MFILFLIFANLSGLGGIVTVENIISVALQILATLGVTQFIKTWKGWGGFGATLLALAVSIVIGVITVAIQMAISGDFSPDKVAGYAVTVFTAATLVYQALITIQKNQK